MYSNDNLEKMNLDLLDKEFQKFNETLSNDIIDVEDESENSESTSFEMTSQTQNPQNNVSILPAPKDISENVETKISLDNIEGIIDLKVLVQDYQNLRQIVLSNSANSKKLLESLLIEIFANDSVDPEMIASYSQLLNTVNSSMKLLTSSYKEISNILMNIHKLNAIQKPKEIKVENVNILSSKEIVERLLKDNSEKLNENS
nr:MAG TPA: Terminase DNA packaging enzyme small [Caudoviricetes sp.]